MGSNVNSDGEAVDHDGMCLEDGVFHSCAPFAISGGVFQELFSGSGKEMGGSHVEADPFAGGTVKPSSTGGILVAENVLVEDYYSSDEPLSPRSAREICKNETSSTIQAMLRSSKHEREELYRARRKLADTLSFLRSKGFSEEQVLEAQKAEGFGTEMPVRNDQGLPCVGSATFSPNPFVDKMKNIVDDSGFSTPLPGTHQVTEKMSIPVSLEKKVRDAPEVPVEKTSEVKETQTEANTKFVPPASKSWANVLKKDSSVPPSFGYFPLGDSKIVEPPLAELRKGNDKFKACVVGTFTKGTKSFKEVNEFAYKLWASKGLQNVYQKDNHTYLFNSVNASSL